MSEDTANVLYDDPNYGLNSDANFAWAFMSYKIND